MATDDAGTVTPETDKSVTEYNIRIVARLEEAFHSDYNIRAACRYAGISHMSYYRWLENIPGFADKMEDAQNKLFQKAGEVIAKNINEGDSSLAFKFMQARDPRYKTKVEAQVTQIDKQVEERLEAVLDDGQHDLQDDGTQPDPTSPDEA